MTLPQPLPDLVSLDLLVSVAERGSINSAAALHHVSQPAASMRLRTLEKVLGLQLLERTSGGSRLTPAGIATVEWARSLLQGMRSLLVGASALRNDSATRLSVAASLTVAEYLMPAWLQSLVATTPSVAVNLHMGNSKAVTDMVTKGEVDIGFVEGPRPPTHLRSRDLGNDDLAIVVAPTDPWASRASITPSELARTPLLLREVGSGTRDVLTRSLAAHGLEAKPLVEMASTTAIKAAACAGSGPAVLSALAVDEEVRDGRLVIVQCTDLALGRRIRAIWSTGRPSPAVEQLLKVVTARRLGTG